MAKQVQCPKCETWVDRLSNEDVCIPCVKEAAKQKVADLAYQRERALEVERIRLAKQAERQAEKDRIDFEMKQAFNAEREAMRELAEREQCRRHLLPFICRFSPNYEAGWVHADICKRLEQFTQDVIDKKSPRLILTMPPRHGKSEIISKTFPAWFLGQFPHLEMIACSYNSALAMDFSRKVRGVMQDPDFVKIFPDGALDPKSQSAERWNTAAGGGYVSAGVSTGITGRGMSIGIIDDPLKDRESAESETIRQGILDWYSSTFYTRLAPAGGIIIVLTRWHSLDLAGELLARLEREKKDAAEAGIELPEDVDNWQLVNYPAIAVEDELFRQKGEALHPERYPLSLLAKIKRTLIPRDWEALYMQRPMSDDGEYFQRHMFRYYDTAPSLDEMRVYAAWDLAVSQKEHADYSCCFIIGVTKEDNIFVLDRIYGRFSSLEILEKMFECQRIWNPQIVGIESGQIELTLEPFLIKRQLEERITIPYEKLKTRGKDKPTRARTLQGRLEQGRVFFPKSAIWTPDVVNEMLTFPLGRNDDQVDSLAWIMNMLLWYAPVRDKKPPKPKSWRDTLKHHTGKSLRKSAMGA